MKETSQNEIYYTTEWKSGQDWVPDYYSDNEGHRIIPVENTTWIIFRDSQRAKERIEEENKKHSFVNHRDRLIIKSEWLNDELNEM